MSTSKVKEKEQEILNKVRDLLEHSQVVHELFKRFQVPLDKLFSVPMEFKDLDVSAKTKDKKIYLNSMLLDDDEYFTEHMHYVVHELCHFLQQITNEVERYKSLDDIGYLDLPTEVEAFSYQIKFIEEFYGPAKAKQYLKDLLDFHEYEGKARDRKSHELLD